MEALEVSVIYIYIYIYYIKISNFLNFLIVSLFLHSITIIHSLPLASKYVKKE